MRDRLRQPAADGGLGYTAAQCRVMQTGQPPPSCGEWFVAVHQGSWRGQGNGQCADEVHGVQVTVTVRAARVPQDAIGESLLAGPTGAGLDEKLEAIRAKLNGDPGPRDAGDPSQYAVLALANATITASANGFVEPLIFLDGGRADEKGPEWFSSPAEGRNPPVGLAQTMTFGGARRVQTIESQT